MEFHIEKNGVGYRINKKMVQTEAKDGDPLIQAMLGTMYLAGVEFRRNVRKGVEWLKKSAEAGCPTGMYCLAMAYYSEEELGDDGTEYIRWMRNAAEAGHPDAQLSYGIHLMLDDSSDPTAVEDLFVKAIGNGKIEAKYHLASFLIKKYQEGSPEFERALSLLKSASEDGHGDSSMLLSSYYESQDNEFMSQRLLRRAADQGCPEAEYIYGILSVDGSTYIESDVKLASELLHRAAAAGIYEAKWTLGVLHLYGLGVPFDLEKAFSYLSEGAMNDDPISLLNLGIMYLKGIGVVKDAQTAAILFTRATNLGSKEAMTNLGALYALGHGVPKDLEKAKSLLEEAKTLGESNAEYNLKALENGVLNPEFDVKLPQNKSVTFVKANGETL